METILSLDPGVTTGYVLGVHEPGKLFLHCEQAKMNENELLQFLLKWRCKHVICEDFKYRRGYDTVELYSRNLIGIVRLYVLQQPVTHLYMQQPSTGEGGYFKGMDKLKELKLWIPGKDHHHGMSAMRHLMYWYTFGQGFQFNDDPMIELVEEQWLYDAYWS